MKRMTNGKRIVSFLLAAAMLLGMFPAIAPSVVPEAEAATTAEFISLPITIRDYANDGMLFEFNELGAESVVASAEKPNMAHTAAQFNPTYRILNGGEGWSVDNGTANGATASTSTINGYQGFTTNSDTNALKLTYNLPTAAGQELQYTNRVEDMRYIVLTFKSSQGVVPATITLTDGTNTYEAAYVAGSAVTGSDATNDTGFTRALYAIPETVTSSGIITSMTIDTGTTNGYVVTNAGEVDYVYSLVTDAYADMATYYVADPTSGFALTNSNNTAVTGTAVTVGTNTITSDETLTTQWSFNGQLFFTLPGDGNAYALAASSSNVLSLTTSWMQGDATCNWTITNKGNGEYTLVRNGRYLYCDANGIWGMSRTERTVCLYTYTGTTSEAPEYGTESGPSTFEIMEVEFFNSLDKYVAQLRCMGNDGSAISDGNGGWFAMLSSALGNTHANNTYTLWTTTGNNKNYGFLQSDPITSSDPQTIGDADADDAASVNSNWMDDLMTESEYINPTGTQTITLNNGVTHTISGSAIRTGLVQSELGANKQLVYEQGTVYYMMEMLRYTLAYEPTALDYAGVERRNFSYVLGTKVINNGEMDLATAIRNQLGSDSAAWAEGTYAEAKTKFENGELAEYTGIETLYDAAYFLLHSIYTDNIGYGQTIEEYTELRLDIVEEIDGVATYVFNSDYTTSYEGGIISNPDQNASDAEFDPIQDGGYGITGSPYIDWAGDSNKSKFDSYNFNMSLEGHAQFIYYYDDSLYFTFSGDDDVYLFINDKLVLDLGAVHGDSEGTVYLNDVAALCGLEDGEAYDFDFYYMERHGHAAHFSIETNIKIVDPAMLTEKTGYQNGTEVGYNGYVNPAEPVTYSFELTNKGESQLTNLIFEDADIGVTVGYNEIIGVSESTTATTGNMTTYADLLVAVYNADGTVKQYVPKGSVTAETLKNLLTAGLKVNERIIIHGFKYKVTTWTDDTYFHNTVQTTATAPGENTTTADDKILNGVASYRVQKPTYAFGTTHYYAWGKLNTDLNDGTLLAASGDITNSVTATNAELLALVNSATNASTGASAGLNITSLSNIQICSASGLTTANYNTKATVNSDGTITYTATETGVDTYYFKATGNDGYTYGPIRVTVFTYGVADNVYVLDYSLPVELNGVNFGLTTNDIVYLADNPFVDKADVTISMSGETSNYGAFELTNGTSSVESVLNGQSLKYTMTEFMSGIDSATITIVIKEGTTTDNRTNGITMIQKLEVAPASVVYYEDDFVDITYVNSTTDDGTGNVWAEYTTGDTVGTEQSADQDSNYGSDPNYSAEKQGTLTLDQDELRSSILEGLTWAKGVVYDKLTEEQKAIVDAIFAKLLERYDATLGGTASNGTIHELILSPGTANSEIMYFDFKGTGFELISRATQDLYAVLTVRVQEGTPNDDGTFTVGDSNGDGVTTSKVVPVITESEGGDVYEVPIIKIDGLPYSNYKVTLSASNSSSANREIYIDGIRIYNPLGTDDELTDVYYSADEEDAEFFEIRPLIVTDEKIVYLDINNGTVTWGTGTTVVEDVGDDETGSNFQVATSTSSDYLNLGPNNEIYLDATADGNTGGTNAAILAFYVTKDSAVEDANRTLQIGVHRKIDGTETDPVYLVYGSTAADIADGIVIDGVTQNNLVISSGTEQYITIDPANLTFDANGKALVLVGTIGGENAASNVLALANLKISGYTLTACGEEMVNAVNGTSAASNELVATGLSLRRMLAAPVVEETTPEETVPEETVPGEAVPEETVPEETVPEETVPEETVPEETVPAVNESLTVNSAKFAAKRVRAGSAAVMTVTTSAGAESLLILDEDGNAVDYTIVSAASSSDSGINGWFAKLIGAIFGGSSDGVTYTISLTVEGSSGDEKTYTVYAVDTEGARSGNFQTAVVTIR